MEHNETNHSNTTVNRNSNTDRNFKDSDIIYLTLYGIMIPLGAIGNGLTIKFFRFSPRWAHAGTKLLVVLAANDLVSSIYVPLEKMYLIYNFAFHSQDNFWNLGMFLCYVMPAITEVLFIATSWLLVLIVFERFRLEIEYPFTL